MVSDEKIEWKLLEWFKGDAIFILDLRELKT
jgi:hypothetical protein